MISHIPLVSALVMIGASFSLLSAADSFPESMTTTVNQASTAKDQSFVDKAVEGGLFEVQSSRIALDKNVPDQVRDFAKTMIRDHSQANDKLVGLAHDNGYKVPERPDLKDRMCLDRLSKADGDAFIKDYDKAQLKAHDEAISLFQKEANDGKDPTMRSFASDTLPVLRHHREMVDGLPYIETEKGHTQSGYMPMSENDQAPVNDEQKPVTYGTARPWNDKRTVDSPVPQNSNVSCQR